MPATGDLPCTWLALRPEEQTKAKRKAAADAIATNNADLSLLMTWQLFPPSNSLPLFLAGTPQGHQWRSCKETCQDRQASPELSRVKVIRCSLGKKWEWHVFQIRSKFLVFRVVLTMEDNFGKPTSETFLTNKWNFFNKWNKPETSQRCFICWVCFICWRLR